MDGAGNVYVADTVNSLVRKITPEGAVSTLAGLARQRGYIDGPGATARFYEPAGIAADAEGNLYVADTGAQLIRKVAPDGVTSTVAGDPGIGGVDDGSVLEARFRAPADVAIRMNGDVLVSDGGNHAIRLISGDGVATLAGLAGGPGAVDGSGIEARFYGPRGVAGAAGGVIYVADTGNSTIRRIAADGAVSTLAGVPGQIGDADGVGAAARFYYPSGLAINAAGDLIVADTTNNKIRRITPSGRVTTIAGGGWRFNGSGDGLGAVAWFSRPTAVAVDALGTIYVADTENYTIRMIDAAGMVTTLAGKVLESGAVDGIGDQARFSRPAGVAVAADGSLYVADGRTLRRITPDRRVTTVAGSPERWGHVDGSGARVEFNRLDGLVIATDGNLFIADGGNNAIRQLTPTGVVTTLGGRYGTLGSTDGVGTDARFNSPAGLALDPDGKLYIADAGSHAVRAGTSFVPAMVPVTIQRSREDVPAGEAITLTAQVPLNLGVGYHWEQNGRAIIDARVITGSVRLFDLQPADTGLYSAEPDNESVAFSGNVAIMGVSTLWPVIGNGYLRGGAIRHPNGNQYVQVFFAGTAEAVTASAGRVTRTSFIDVDGDIVQVELGGPGTLAVVLDEPFGPSAPQKYHQPGVEYMKGHAGLVITGATENTHLSVFSVGRATAYDPTGVYDILRAPDATTNIPANNGSPLFSGHDATEYDGIADLAFLAITSTTGRFGSVRMANAALFAERGYTGLYAPGVEFTGPVYLGDVSAFATAVPVVVLGSAADVRITGGDLFQDNGEPVRVGGIRQLRFTAGSDSHGRALPAQANRAVLIQNGVDVTAQIVVAP